MDINDERTTAAAAREGIAMWREQGASDYDITLELQMGQFLKLAEIGEQLRLVHSAVCDIADTLAGIPAEDT